MVMTWLVMRRKSLLRLRKPALVLPAVAPVHLVVAPALPVAAIVLKIGVGIKLQPIGDLIWLHTNFWLV